MRLVSGREEGSPSCPETRDRLAGGLWGVCVGDALGATVESLSPQRIVELHGRHTEIVGGGPWGWLPGQGTDDSDLTIAIARAYAAGYSLHNVARRFVAWYDSRPPDIGRVTARALKCLKVEHNPRTSGQVGDRTAGNGGLMRAITTGLVRRDPLLRRAEAAELCAITHADPLCVDASVAYCDLVALLLEGTNPTEAVQAVAATPMNKPVRSVLVEAQRRDPGDFPTFGFVLNTLRIAVWAVCAGIRQPSGTFEQVLADVANLGGDADTNAAVAGGLLGAHLGVSAIPARWCYTIEYGPEIAQLLPQLLKVRDSSTKDRS